MATSKKQARSQVEKMMANQTLDMVAFIVMLVGVLLIPADFLVFGGVLIGAVFGIYFHGEILENVQNVREIFQQYKLYKFLALVGALLGLVLMNPALVITGLVAALVTNVVKPYVCKSSGGGSKEEIDVTPSKEEE